MVPGIPFCSVSVKAISFLYERELFVWTRCSVDAIRQLFGGQGIITGVDRRLCSAVQQGKGRDSLVAGPRATPRTPSPQRSAHDTRGRETLSNCGGGVVDTRPYYQFVAAHSIHRTITLVRETRSKGHPSPRYWLCGPRSAPSEFCVLVRVDSRRTRACARSPPQDETYRVSENTVW